MKHHATSLTLALLLSLTAAPLARAQDVESYAPGSDQAVRVPGGDHAASHENVNMLRLAHDAPERFVGNMLKMSDGRKAGQVLAVKRRRLDKLLYLIIQAEPYFKRDIQFAVPVLDVDRFEGPNVILTDLPGNFLRGMEYETAEYENIDSFDGPLPSADE